MNITVFGGSQPKEGDTAYQDARLLGEMLAQRGHVVLTGGYIGTMEAASRGAAEAGGQVIGITCADISRWRGIGANRWVTEEWKKENLHERLQALIENCDAAIALPGGAGTMTEISLMWNLMIVESIHPRPLILVGEGWQSIIDQVFEAQAIYINQSHRALLQFAHDVRTAVKQLESWQV